MRPCPAAAWALVGAATCPSVSVGQGRTQSGTRVDGDFEYYETLSEWTSAGAFDRNPSLPGGQPELDADAYRSARSRGLAGRLRIFPGRGVRGRDWSVPLSGRFGR